MNYQSKVLSVICLSHLAPNINNTHHYYLASFVVAAKKKIRVIDELSYFMLAERELRVQRALLMGTRTVINDKPIIDNCSIGLSFSQNT